MTMNLFYFKCVAIVTTQLLLQCFSGVSQAVSYTSLQFGFYNLTMVSLGCLLYGMFEIHLPQKLLISRPHLYRTITRQSNLRVHYILTWVLNGLWHGIVVFFIAHLGLAGNMGPNTGPAIFYHNGLDPKNTYDANFIGTACFILLFFTVNIRIALASKNFDVIIGFGFLLTMINVLFFYLMEPKIFIGLFLSPAFWLTLILVVTTANLPDLIWRILSDTWWYLEAMGPKHTHGQRRQKHHGIRTWMSALARRGKDGEAAAPNTAAPTNDIGIPVRRMI